jgi:hypothetical protein
VAYETNNGHRWARLYRRVSHRQMTKPTVVAEYDTVRNIIYINETLWDTLSESEKAKVWRYSTFE